ncbi:MAG TPA: MHYT domain-containing protein [Rhizomicrobium sp.]|jgi:signal transduction histidine kinase|nr:MHYT domain-containing protein [Rhizomicrobium sp.]
MFRVLGCVFEQHDLRLVALAGLLCLFACAAAISMMRRARVAHDNARTLWLLSAGAVAGGGIWGTHFIAMLAYQAGFPVAYDLWLTLISALIAMALCGAGFAIALSGLRPAIGGAVAGAAIGIMHYVGMAAVRAPADMLWDWSYVAASVVIGIVMMAAAMDYIVRKDTPRAYAIGAVLFTLAICSMHFTGMSAVTLRYDPLVAVPNAVMAPGMLAIAVAASAVLIAALGLIGAMVDSHLESRSEREAVRLRAHITELEATKGALEETSSRLTLALEAAAAANHAKSAFLAAMSHELRTPLNAIIGFSEVMATEAFGPMGLVRYRDYAKDIHASGGHLLALINDILDLSRIDAGDARLTETDIDLGALAGECLRMIDGQAAKGELTLSLQGAAGLPKVRGDTRRLKQVLINLLANAVKFTPVGGKIAIKLARTNAGISLAVEDSGIGIAPADIPRALERFGQVDSSLARKYDGVGLGLPLAKQLMELHGGTLTLASKLHIGTTVTVTLPDSRVVDTPKQSAAA